MKRILTILTVIMLVLVATPSVQAQSKATPHFKFMGIPINGTITNFQSKLAAKGFTYDAKISNGLDPGIRCYNGMFAGYKAKLGVYFNPKTKLVYETKVIIFRNDMDACKNLYGDMRSELFTKYEGRCINEEDKTDAGYDRTTLWVYYNDEKVGGIRIYIKEDEYNCWVSIEYVDFENYDKHQATKRDDL